MIRFNDLANPEKFVSKHHVHFASADGYEVFTLSGVAIFDWKTNTGAHWSSEDVEFDIGVPGVPADKGLQVHMWAPFVALSSISNDKSAVNAGWAVDNFHLVHGPRPFYTGNRVTIGAKIAGRDSDGHILRLSFMVTLKGRFVDQPPGPF